MKVFYFFFIFLSLLNCSHQGHEHSEQFLSRTIASENFTENSFLENLNRGLKAFPRLGNPRFYLFEHFANRSKILIDSINDQNESQRLLSLWASYKVMTEAGIYLNFSFLVNKDNPEVVGFLEQMDAAMADLKLKLNQQVKIEDEEVALKIERKYLIQKLANRISRDYKLFVKNERDQMYVQFFLRAVKNLKSNSFKAQYSSIILDPKYKKTQKLLSNLPLIENGNIDGLDESLEKVMSVQMSSELIHWLFERELRS